MAGIVEVVVESPGGVFVIGDWLGFLRFTIVFLLELGLRLRVGALLGGASYWSLCFLCAALCQWLGCNKLPSCLIRNV
jgi:hypothetical protein